MRFFAITSIFLTAALGVLAGLALERQAPKSVAVVLTDLTNTIAPLANQLAYATTSNATQETVTPIISDMSTAVNGAVTGLKMLVGQPAEVIMTSPDGTAVLTASDVASLLATILNLTLMATNAILSVVEASTFPVIFSLLTTLVQAVASLLTVLISLVVDLLPPLLSLLEPILSIVGSLGLGNLLSELLGDLL